MKLCGAKIYLLTRTKSDITSDTGEAEVRLESEKFGPFCQRTIIFHSALVRENGIKIHNHA